MKYSGKINENEDEENKPMEDKKTVRAVVRAFCLIEALAKNDGQPKGIQELSNLTNMTKATVHRQISTLVNIGYVDQDTNGKYLLGLNLISLSAVILNRLQLVKVAQEELDFLSIKTDLTSHLGVIDNNDLLYLAKANSNLSIQTTSYVGQRSYLHSTSLGKAICAYLPVERVMKCLNEKGMPRFTVKTITTIEDYLNELDYVKNIGYAIDNEENEKYIRCIAVPIFDFTGCVIASISVSGLVIHLKEEMFVDLPVLVKEAANRISKKMGYSNVKY
jgi:DNA-binding IclR family transcriptional regulator